MALMLFGCTGALIVPFVRLYTAGITDADYIQPVFALLLLLAEAMNCLALPYTTLPISANQLKQSRWGSYGEAILNLGVSLCLIWWNPLVGIALGTILATCYKSFFYMHYTAKHILHCGTGSVIGRFFLAMGLLAGISCCGMTLLWNVVIKNYFVWILWAMITFVVIGAVVVVFGILVYPGELKPLLPGKGRKSDKD